MERVRDNTWKCRATGKVGFPSLIEAQWAMLHFKFRSRVRNKLDGKRIKHRMGKDACKRAYYCKFCKGYHITTWEKGHFNNYKDKAKSWEIPGVLGNWNYSIE
ncbi:hypothetical protein ACR789_18400 [Sphingobacterium siyangense]|uniref:hypothetical protein n=1 Tax=Sphingobacterium TaxID=28453 RepID=UPI0028B1135B|nr:hypothetical protein [Sphingobacterium multivorum]